MFVVARRAVHIVCEHGNHILVRLAIQVMDLVPLVENIR